MFDVSGRTSVFCVGPNPLWQKITNVEESMTIWTSTILSGLSYKKNANRNRIPCKATLRKSSSGTASRSAWVAKSSSLEACYVTSQAWLFQKPWHFSWKKNKPRELQSRLIASRIHISFHWISWILWNSSTASTSPKPSESIFWHKKNHSHTSSAVDPLHKSRDRYLELNTKS